MLYKVTGPKGEAVNGGTGSGKWMPEVPDPVPAERQWQTDRLVHYLNGGQPAAAAEGGE